jgi:2-aminoadipate transaminase
VIGIPLHSDGLDVEMVETRLKAGERPVLFYIIPDFQNPSGMELSLEKREKLAALAEKYGFWIIEDSPYRKLRYRGLEISTIHELAPDKVVYLSSFSKLISPGLRVGYSVLPEPMAPKFLKFTEDTYVTPSLFNQGIVFEFIHRGWLDPNIDRLKNLYQPRLDVMLQTLNQEFKEIADWYKPDGGFFVGMTLKHEMDLDNLLEKSKAAGILLSDGRGFFAQSPQKCLIRLPFCALTPQEIQSGIIQLAAVIREIK